MPRRTLVVGHVFCNEGLCQVARKDDLWRPATDMVASRGKRFVQEACHKRLQR